MNGWKILNVKIHYNHLKDDKYSCSCTCIGVWKFCFNFGKLHLDLEDRNSCMQGSLVLSISHNVLVEMDCENENLASNLMNGRWFFFSQHQTSIAVGVCVEVYMSW